MVPATLIFNPAAGRGLLSPLLLQRVIDRFRRLGVSCRPLATTPGMQGQPPLDPGPSRLLIVWGGDGTVHQVLNRLVRRDLPLGILPGGTANVLARELGIPMNLERASELIVQGRRRRIFLGRANGELFHLMAGIGPDGYIVRRINPRLKRRTGVFSYWYAGLRLFWRYPLRPFNLQVDGQDYVGTFAVVGKARTYGGQLFITPRARLDEPLLDVCLFSGRNRLRFLRYLMAAPTGSHLGFPDVTYLKTQRLRVFSEFPVPVQADGEARGHLPLSCSVCRTGVEVIVR